MAFNSAYLAPNGEPSNLTPEQYRLVRSPEFKAWFGDWENDPETASKVVDENGEPLVVYHGTNTQFNVFDKNFIGSSNDSGFYGKGFYFNHNSIDVKQYGNIIKTYFLKIKNPVITYDSPKEFSTSIWIPKGAKNLLGQGLEPYEWHKWNFYLDDNFSKKVTDYILEMGRDGIIAENVGEYVIYEPNQIKLADGTNTTLDGNNPDIRYAKGGRTIDVKQKQLEIINSTNPAPNEYNTWIRKVEDIKTAEQVFSMAFEDGAMYPDFQTDDMTEALHSGYLTVFSSYPIKEGVFVTPSKMNALEYAGGKNGKIFSKRVKLTDIAWIDESEGQYAPTEFYADGGRTISQTPSPTKDRVYGSQVNPKKSSSNLSSALKIEFSAETTKIIKDKVEKHNAEYPNKQITVESAKAVVRRGMGAYSKSHRPTISGGKPNSRVAWGLARLNAFIYKILNGKSKSGKYKQDDDLISELGYKVSRFDNGGKTDIPTRFFGSQAGGVLIYCKTTNRVLLLLRSPFVLEPFTLGTISGKVEGNEQIEETVKREAYEETGFELKTLYPSYIFERPNFKFFNFISIVEQEFEPQLDWENIDYLWTSLDNLPENMHFGLVELLKHGKIQETVKQLTSRFKKGRLIKTAKNYLTS